MSTGTKRPLAQALTDIDDFRRLIMPERTCERFEVAGSVRRLKPEVSDVDIVCIPKFDMMPGEADMFGQAEPVRTNLLWQRVDDLVAAGTFSSHIKDTAAGPRAKWGESCRAINFRGMAYEVQIADVDNFWPWMAIRTGPAELSHEFAKRLGDRLKDGFHLWTYGDLVKGCTEEQFFKAAGLPFKPPHHR